MRRLRSFASNVAAVAYREATVVRHDPTFLGVVAAQPVMMLLLFGLALSNEPANVPWAVLDQSQSAASRRASITMEPRTRLPSTSSQTPSRSAS